MYLSICDHYNLQPVLYFVMHILLLNFALLSEFGRNTSFSLHKYIRNGKKSLQLCLNCTIKMAIILTVLFEVWVLGRLGQHLTSEPFENYTASKKPLISYSILWMECIWFCHQQAQVNQRYQLSTPTGKDSTNLLICMSRPTIIHWQKKTTSGGRMYHCRSLQFLSPWLKEDNPL